MRRILVLSLVALSAFFVTDARNSSSAISIFGNGRRDVIVQKNFELCWHLANDPKVSALLAADPVLSDITRRGRDLFNDAETEDDAVMTALFSDQKTAEIGDRLSALASQPKIAKLCVALREHGRYFIFNNLPDEEFIKAAWAQDAGGINRILKVYALGEKPKYKVDIPDPNLHQVPFYDKAMANVIRPSIRESALEITREGSFFSLSLEVALKYLDINNRYEAADFEPLGENINEISYAAVRRARWNDYKYSAILVLGSGPQVEGEAISPKCRVRCAYAAELYLRGLAPFIILSGGRAHPAMTTISEAEEMKLYLMDNYGIPEKALIAEPHARHTTTNLRNAARIMLGSGFPTDKPALITSTSDQLDSVQSDKFESRCIKEMFVYPIRLGQRTGNFTLEFWPLPCASQVNPLDPLDP